MTSEEKKNTWALETCVDLLKSKNVIDRDDTQMKHVANIFPSSTT